MSFAHPGRLARRLLRQALLKGLRPRRLRHDPPLQGRELQGATLRRLSVQGARGQRLATWLALPDTARMRLGPEPVGRVPVVVALHGWGANAATLWDLVQPLVSQGIAVSLFDTACHGESSDEDFSSLPRFADDLNAVIHALRLQPDLDATRMALIGHSVGAAAVVLHAARRGHIRALIGLALFANPQDMMVRWLQEHRIPQRWIGRAIIEEVQAIIGERYSQIAPERLLPRVRCPVLLVHGRQDTVVPIEDARRLERALRERDDDAPQASRLLMVDGDHDLRAALRPHVADLVGFLRTALDKAVPIDPAGMGTMQGLPAEHRTPDAI